MNIENNTSTFTTGFFGNNWESKKDNLKTRYPFLRDSDLAIPQGSSLSMFNELAHKLGLSEDDLHIVILTS